LNWFAKGSLSNYDEVLARRPPSQIVMSPVPRAYDIVSERMVRFFIPPLYSKFFANPFWGSIWEAAFVKLTHAQSLVIIGCSLIESDYHLRAIILRALARRRRKLHRIVICNRSQETQRRIKRLFRGQADRVDVVDTFTRFVRDYCSP
jgi:hypothetical protein